MIKELKENGFNITKDSDVEVLAESPTNKIQFSYLKNNKMYTLKSYDEDYDLIHNIPFGTSLIDAINDFSLSCDIMKDCTNEITEFEYSLFTLNQKIDYLYDKVYENNAAGGGLHIVLDDGNLSDRSINWCIDNVDLTEYEKKLVELLLSITEEERVNCLSGD